jgi:hypothetical protein
VGNQSRVGQVVVDVVDLEGDIAMLKADVLATTPPLTQAELLLHGTPPEPRVALMLVGSKGRYVALSLDGGGGPLALEWALGERRGTMLGQDSPGGTVHLELEVDAEGSLRAYVGTGKDRRSVGEPLILGRDWQKHFGKVPRPAVGCIDGTCRVEGLSYSVKPAPPSATGSTVAELTPPPRPPSSKGGKRSR